jgi:hypothetical protein
MWICPIVGGNWNNNSNAGVWMMNCNNHRSNSNNNVGARADSASPQTATCGLVPRETLSCFKRNRNEDAFLVGDRKSGVLFFKGIYEKSG